MFDNLKIGKKMLLLSGTILCLLLGVLLVGMYSLSHVVKSGEHVSEAEELRAELAGLEIDHLNWVGHVATFLNDDSVNDLDVQVDPHQCGFGKWYYGEGRQKAEQLLPDLRSNLQAIEGSHATLHGSAKKIKAAYRAADPHLPEFLTEKELDHVSWAYKIQRAIIVKDSGVKLQFDHTKCSLGQFLYGEEGRKAVASNPDLESIFLEMRAPHEKLHERGKKINSLLMAGKFAEATDYFAVEATQTLREVSVLVHQARQIAVDALKGKQEANLIFNTETQGSLKEVQKQLGEMRDKVFLNAEKLIEENAGDIKVQTMTVILIGVVALILGGLIAVLISRSLTGPMRKTVNMLDELEKGHLDNRLQLNRKDEIGLMAESMDRFADLLQNEVVNSLQRLADGDLTFDVTPRSEKDELRGAIKKLGSDLNGIMAQIQLAGKEISSASGEIADSSQSLSEGATESAASLEEISASLNQTSSQTSINAENAAQANSLSTETKLAAEKGSKQMQAMVSAMSQINETSHDISKIIKTIDEIAFQTNLLALNAAVEAARAGQHGKGFAVVAEEVRNLAARSAKAAAETSELIEGSLEKTVNGSTIADQTAEALEGIVAGISKVTDIVAEISASSNEQAQGIAEINLGVSRIDTVTQQNTASAEESAAAAEELSAQAVQLHQMLTRFRLKEEQGIASPIAQVRNFSAARSRTGSGDWGAIAENSMVAPTRPFTQAPKQQIVLDDTEFGKF